MLFSVKNLTNTELGAILLDHCGVWGGIQLKLQIVPREEWAVRRKFQDVVMSLDN